MANGAAERKIHAIRENAEKTSIGALTLFRSEAFKLCGSACCVVTRPFSVCAVVAASDTLDGLKCLDKTPVECPHHTQLVEYFNFFPAHYSSACVIRELSFRSYAPCSMLTSKSDGPAISLNLVAFF